MVSFLLIVQIWIVLFLLSLQFQSQFQFQSQSQFQFNFYFYFYFKYHFLLLFRYRSESKLLVILMKKLENNKSFGMNKIDKHSQILHLLLPQPSFVSMPFIFSFMIIFSSSILRPKHGEAKMAPIAGKWKVMC